MNGDLHRDLTVAINAEDWEAFARALGESIALERAHAAFLAAGTPPADRDALGACFHELGGAFAEGKELALAVEWFVRAVDTSLDDPAPEPAGVVASLEDASTCLLELAQYDTAARLLRRGLERLGGLGLSDEASVPIQLALGDCGVGLEDWPTALEHYCRAAEAATELSMLGVAMHQAGYCSFKAGRVAEAKAWFEGAIRAREAGGDPRGVARSMQSVAVCCGMLGDIEAAREWRRQARIRDPR